MTLRHRRPLPLVAILVLLSCGRDGAKGTTAGGGGGCDDVRTRWASALKQAPGVCTTDADCGCFNGGVDKSSGCGGVTDRATAATLEKLRADFQQAQCTSGIDCAAWSCAPKCTAGRCTNG